MTLHLPHFGRSGHCATDVQAGFVAGTAAVSPLAAVYYAHAKRSARFDHVYALHRGGLGPLDGTYDRFERWADDTFDPERPLLLAGHSQGGLHVIRYAANRSHVCLAITVSSPIKGTPAARLIGFTGAGHDMSPCSRYLAQLHDELPKVIDRLVTISVRRDVLVPSRSAHVPGARQYRFGAGHITEMFDGPVLRCLIGLTDETRGLAALVA